MPPKTLLEKFSMLVSSNLSELVGPLNELPRDKTPTTPSGHVRKLERDIREINKTAHEMIEQLRKLHDRMDAYEHQCRDLDHAVNVFLENGLESRAKLAQTKLNRLNLQMKRTHDELKEWESRLLLLKEKRDRFEAVLADARKKAEEQEKREAKSREKTEYWVVDE